MQVRVDIKNFKKIADLSQDFTSGHLYFVRASNQKGKTSFCQAVKTVFTAMNDVTTPVTFGENEGQIVATVRNYKNEEGNNVKVIFDFTNEKESFKLITADTSTLRNKNQIRDFFKYNHFTVDDFFAWGKTAEGRRKQAKVLFSLMPENIQKEISQIDTLINEKNGVIFLQRKEANQDHIRYKKAIEANQLTPQEIAVIQNEEVARKKLDDYRQELQKLNAIPAHNAIVTEKINSLNNLYNAVSTTKSLSQDRMLAIQSILDEQTAEIQKELQDDSDIMVQIHKVNESIVNGQRYIENIVALKTKQSDYQKNLANVQKANDESLRLTGELEKHRIRKKDLYASAKLNPALEIIDDELFYRTDDDNVIPFDADSLSYSVAGLIVADFILRLNQDTPIVLLGMAGEYDKKALEKLDRMAGEYNAIIFADKVEYEDDKELTISVYEK
jgi:hypothetical protein